MDHENTNSRPRVRSPTPPHPTPPRPPRPAPITCNFRNRKAEDEERGGGDDNVYRGVTAVQSMICSVLETPRRPPETTRPMQAH